MPEYLAPGVFVEEVSYRAKSIEGVSTTTTGFVGPTRYGPIDLEPDIITSLVEFERIYGGKDRLVYEDDGETDNYMWNAVRAFFEEGGKRLYVARASRRRTRTTSCRAARPPSTSPARPRRPRRACWNSRSARASPGGRAKAGYVHPPVGPEPPRGRRGRRRVREGGGRPRSGLGHGRRRPPAAA